MLDSWPENHIHIKLGNWQPVFDCQGYQMWTVGGRVSLPNGLGDKQATADIALLDVLLRRCRRRQMGKTEHRCTHEG